MNKIANFEKVSFEEFKKSLKQLNLDFSNNEEIYNNIKLPKRATTGSAGYDFFAPFNILLKPNQSIFIPTGIRCKINEGWVLQIFPRSGLGIKFRLNLDNTVGIIDCDYYYSDNEGHIMIKITNSTLENKILEITTGNGFAQGIFIPFGITFDDNTTESRNGGFGSTTKQ